MGLALAEPAAPDQAGDTNPVRIAVSGGGFRPGRVVQIVFTDFAAIRTRSQTLFGATPEEACKVILDLTRLRPADLKVKTQQLGDIAVLREMPLTDDPALKPSTTQPIAFVDGLTTDEMAAALAALNATWSTLSH